MPEPVAELSAVHVTYAQQPVLADVDLRLSAGEFLALVGPSGAGKSTLLRVLSGLQRPTSGRVRRPEDYGGATRSVFQDPHLLPWRTVAGNVRLGLEYRANGGRWLSGRAAADARVDRVLRELGIVDLAHRYPAQLSGGQAQRVAVARAVVAEPTLLLLDEPFGALDPLTRGDLQDWLRGVHERLGLSTVLVTHDLEEALLLGDRIGLLHADARPVEFLESTVTDRAGLADGAARQALLTRFAAGAERDELAGTDLRPGPATATATEPTTAAGPPADPATGPPADTAIDSPTDPATAPPTAVTGPPAAASEPAAAATDAAADLVAARRRATRRELLTAAGALALVGAPVLGSLVVGRPERGRAATAAAAGDGVRVTTGAPATLRIGYLPITDAAPLLLAHDRGTFAARVLQTPAPVLYRGWAPLVEALQGGSVDIVHLLMPLAVQLRYGAGVPVKVLAWNHTNGSALTVATSVRSVADLAGTTVAIPAWFSVHNVVLQKLLREAGIRPVIDTAPSAAARTTQLVVVPPADMPVALKSGSIAGYIVAEPFCAVAEVLGIGKILRFTGDVWRDHACCVTVVRESLVRDRPDVAARAAEAIVAAQLGLRADRAGSARRLSAGGYLPQPLPALQRVLAERQDPAYESSGAIRHPQWQSRRIDFQPYPYPSYTSELVRAMKETTVDADVPWLDRIDPEQVHADLVATDVSAAAVNAAGGLAAFGVPGVRTEVVAP